MIEEQTSQTDPIHDRNYSGKSGPSRGEQRLSVLSGQIRFRQPREEDGPGIWQLVRSTGVLDLNSAYSYMMLCKYFSGTCVAAEHDNEIIGFLSAFKPPGRPDEIFVWQVGVAPSQHRKGMGSTMLQVLLKRKECAGVRFLVTTITPSNIPSQSLFRKLARNVGARCEVEECFPADLFPGSNHEAELMYRIGPITSASIYEREAIR
ncbi:MAG: diaminobutyrate acetyltransferase [Bacillota bacterium]